MIGLGLHIKPQSDPGWSHWMSTITCSFDLPEAVLFHIACNSKTSFAALTQAGGECLGSEAKINKGAISLALDHLPLQLDYIEYIAIIESLISWINKGQTVGQRLHTAHVSCQNMLECCVCTSSRRLDLGKQGPGQPRSILNPTNTLDPLIT